MDVQRNSAIFDYFCKLMEVKELFDICRQLAGEEPSATATHRMHELLVLCCSEGCRREGGTFGGLFAQVDFLCKRYGIANEEKREVQTMRRHSNSYDPANDQEWTYDLRALALLVSAVFGESVPGELRRLLPSQSRPREKGLRINRRYLRCIVQSWDEHVVHATTDDGEVVIDYANQSEGRDFRYLRKILREGMQLNLLDCYMDSGEGRVVTPGLVVVEPDFLLDISSVAACFTNYGHHPLLYTVNRLKPKPNTQAVLLGNFAGTALDELIHSGADASLSAMLKRSFREQALRFCACNDFDAEQFKRDAELQTNNIRQAVDVLFNTDSSLQDSSLSSLHSPLSTLHSPLPKALLEPSFVCEQLGLQGRVDLMTSDMTLLVEQKSGKNPKIEHQSHDQHGMQLESHYVQLLLYYGILRQNFGRTSQTVDIRLLYSRYPAAQGLMSVSYYQQLFREAIRLRNQIVATELLVAREGFGRILPLLTPAVIYKGIAKDRIFHEYVEPELMELTAQLAALTPIERAYYERMMTFVYREQACQKLGNGETRLQHSGGATCDTWLMPLSEKQETGSIITNLSICKRERSNPYSGYDLITLSLPHSSLEDSSLFTLHSSLEDSSLFTLHSSLNFRRGDMVFLYAYKEHPDVRQSILYKGSIEELGTSQVTVLLNNGQQRPDLLPMKDTLWAIEHASTDASASAQMRSLHQFICASPDRKALLLGQRPPKAAAHHPSPESVEVGFRLFQDYFLLVGPPGTGKTSMAMRFMVEDSLGTPGSQLLLMSYTNRAVDEICAMLESAHVDYLRVGSEASCDPLFRSRLLEASLSHIGKLSEMKEYIQQTRVVVATTSTVQSRQEILQLKHFSLCIVDEASQILEPSLIGLLSSDHIDRFVLIGDHKQLPAVVQQSEEDARVADQLLIDICIDDCRQSLFERLLRWEHRCGRTQFVYTLNHQGRMHPDVARFPSTAFYAEEHLDIVPLPHQQADSLGYDLPAEDRLDCILKEHRVAFFDCDSSLEDSSLFTLHSSLQEARLVAQLLRRIHRFYGSRFSATKTVGVIVPYRNQIAMIRQEIALLDIPELLDISIDTVERYQGSQRDVIIYSFTVTRQYQLDFLAANTFVENGHLIDRKLNVALTRARCQMLMTGCARVLSQNPLFRQLIQQYRCDL